MNPLTRRAFFKTGATCAALGSTASFSPVLVAATTETPKLRSVHFTGDGIPLSPSEYARLLVVLAEAGKAKSDSYLASGAVETMEQQFAKILGKERALFFPTGTLANHLALRHLASGKRRVLVPAESHIYCDSLDCVQTLSHLNLVPLAEGRATFTLEEVNAACERAAGGPFPSPVGAIAIECPVRRRDGAVFDFSEMKRITAHARKNELKMHLDGARLFIASAYTGIAPADYAALFDTVYVSLYKCFNAGSGAVLAGPSDLLEPLAHDRKVFGAGLHQAWVYAAVASHFLDGYLERLSKAVAVAAKLFALLGKHPRLRVESYPDGTNVHRLHVDGADLKTFRSALRAKGVSLLPPASKFSGFTLMVNESLHDQSPTELAELFTQVLPN